MKNYETDEIFLARWMAGELTEEERISFEKTEVFKQFDVINKEVQLLSGPEIDTEKALATVKQQLQQESKKSKVIRLWQSIAAAAIIILGTGFFLTSSKTYTTGIGETQQITLSDGSIIDLNANSSLTHKRFFWEKNKEVTLNGEGYFTITKGDDFKVQTTAGTIHVLGTQFNIKDRTDFELKCYEGKVNFAPKKTTSKSYILTQGMQVNITNSKIKEQQFEEIAPAWKQGISSFNEEPISMVLEELTHYYPITFDATNINTNRLFSGSFKHDNLETALNATLTPMGIAFEKPDSNNIIMLSE